MNQSKMTYVPVQSSSARRYPSRNSLPPAAFDNHPTQALYLSLFVVVRTVSLKRETNASMATETCMTGWAGYVRT